MRWHLRRGAGTSTDPRRAWSVPPQLEQFETHTRSGGWPNAARRCRRFRAPLGGAARRPLDRSTARRPVARAARGRPRCHPAGQRPAHGFDGAHGRPQRPLGPARLARQPHRPHPGVHSGARPARRRGRRGARPAICPTTTWRRRAPSALAGQRGGLRPSARCPRRHVATASPLRPGEAMPAPIIAAVTNVFRRSLDPALPVAARAEGSTIWDADGKAYLDAAGGAIVVGVGHGRESVARVMAEQASRVAYAHGSAFTSDAVEAYASALAPHLPMAD